MTEKGCRLLHRRLLCLTQGLEGVEGGKVVLHLTHGGHAGEDSHNIGQAGHPPEGPGGGRRLGTEGSKDVHHIGRWSRQRAAFHRFHDDDGDPHLLGETIALQTGLLLRVHIVELDLTAVPASGSEDLVELLIAAMEGKSEVPKIPRSLPLQTPVHHAGVQHLVPPGTVKVVEEVEVQIVLLQPLPLLGVDPLCILQGVDQGGGQFRGEIVALSGVARQGSAHKRLTLAVVVEIGGIKVVDSALIGPVQHGHGLLLVDGTAFQGGKPHAAKTQQGRLYAQLFLRSSFHMANLLYSLGVLLQYLSVYFTTCPG